MSYITEPVLKNANYIYEQLLGDFTKQPVKVTVNNMINEWPSAFPPTESMISAGTKVYMVSEVVHFFGPAAGIHAKELKGDSTYKGQFMQNAVSATKNFRLWYEGVPRGTRVHGLDRPIADLLKGFGKIALIASFPIASQYIFVTNFACELVGYSFVITVENIQNRNGDVYDYKEWLEEMSKSEFWLDSSRRAFAQTLSAWFVMGWVIKPVEHYLGDILSKVTPKDIKMIFNHDWALKDLTITHTIGRILSSEYVSPVVEYMGNIIKYIPAFGSYVTNLRIPEIVWLPSMVNYGTNVVIGMLMVPTVRTATYKINPNIKVVVEQNDLLSCMKIGDVFELAKFSNKTIDYKYDAYKVAKNASAANDDFLCDVGRGKKVAFNQDLSNQAKQDCSTQLIIHYPKEDDTVEQIINSFKNCNNDPVYCALTTVDTVIGGVHSAAEYVKDAVVSMLSNPFYASLVSIVFVDLFTKAVYHHLPGSTSPIDDTQ